MRKEDEEKKKERETRKEKDIKDEEDNIFFLFICLFIVYELFISILHRIMANSTEKNEQEMFNSSDRLPYRVQFSNDNRNSPPRKPSTSITQDDSSIASRQGLY
jgi:hypothetical protein